MKIKYLAHASFLITSDTGTKIITDPYADRPEFRYGMIHESADVVTVSHEHSDHSNSSAIGGNPAVVKGTAKAKGIEFKGVYTYHDQEKGEKRGKNTIFCFTLDGMHVCHLGDLGHPLSDAQVAEIGKVDVLFVPVGGFYTIDANAATMVCNSLSPRIVIPMHYKTVKCDFPIAPVSDFLKGKDNVTLLGVSEAEFKKDMLPGNTQIVVLEPSL